jgi:hypothetical protein
VAVNDITRAVFVGMLTSHGSDACHSFLSALFQTLTPPLMATAQSPMQQDAQQRPQEDWAAATANDGGAPAPTNMNGNGHGLEGSVPPPRSPHGGGEAPGAPVSPSKDRDYHGENGRRMDDEKGDFQGEDKGPKVLSSLSLSLLSRRVWLSLSGCYVGCLVLVLASDPSGPISCSFSSLFGWLRISSSPVLRAAILPLSRSMLALLRHVLNGPLFFSLV